MQPRRSCGALSRSSRPSPGSANEQQHNQQQRHGTIPSTNKGGEGGAGQGWTLMRRSLTRFRLSGASSVLCVLSLRSSIGGASEDGTGPLSSHLQAPAQTLRNTTILSLDEPRFMPVALGAGRSVLDATTRPGSPPVRPSTQPRRFHLKLTHARGPPESSKSSTKWL